MIPDNLTENQTLGTLTKNPSTTSGRRLDLLRSAQEILAQFDHRTCMCCTRPVPEQEAIEVYVDRAAGTGSFGGLMKCGSVWTCPVCSARISEERRSELLQAVNTWKSRGYTVLMLTLTLRHKKQDKLKEVLNKLRHAHKLFTSGRFWQDFKEKIGFYGSVRALEFTWSDENGWHPHEHILLFCEREPGHSYSGALTSARKRWQSVVKTAGGYANVENGCDLQERESYIAEYIAKFGKLPSDMEKATSQDMQGWNESHEIAKAVNKRAKGEKGSTPFALLEQYAAGDTLAGFLFGQYAEAVKGFQQLSWSAGLKDELLEDLEEKSDQELAEETETQKVCDIDLSLWKQIVRERMRGRVMDAAIAGDQELKDLLEDIKTRVFEGWQTCKKVSKGDFTYVIQEKNGLFRAALYWKRQNTTNPAWRTTIPSRTELRAMFLCERAMNRILQEEY